MCYFSADNRVLEHFRLKLRTKVVLDTLADMLCKFADYKSSLLSIAKISIIAVPIYHSDNFSPFFIEQHRVKKNSEKRPDFANHILSKHRQFHPKISHPSFSFDVEVFRVLCFSYFTAFQTENFGKSQLCAFFDSGIFLVDIDLGPPFRTSNAIPGNFLSIAISGHPN